MDKNTQFFLGMASNHSNMIFVFYDEDTRLEGRDEIIEHTMRYFKLLYPNEVWDWPYLDNLEFDHIGEEEAVWLERTFRMNCE